MKLDKLVTIADKVVDIDESSVPAIEPTESPGDNIQTDVNTMTNFTKQEEQRCERSNFRRRLIKGLKTLRSHHDRSFWYKTVSVYSLLCFES